MGYDKHINTIMRIILVRCIKMEVFIKEEPLLTRG